jgi:hypothetical protein
MNPRYREIHRAEIKRRMFSAMDRRWDALYGAFVASVTLVGFGVDFCLIPRSGSCVIGATFLVLGALFFAAYRWLLHLLQDRGSTREWLKPIDQLITAALICFAVALSNLDSEIWFAAFVMAGAYGTWRLWQNSRPYWRVYYFRAGRQYLREIERLGAKRGDKRRAPDPAR